jgi:hypothetical protein
MMTRCTIAASRKAPNTTAKSQSRVTSGLANSRSQTLGLEPSGWTGGGLART